MSAPNTTAASANAPAAPKPVNTQFEPELDSLPEDLPTTPEAPRQAGAVSTAATPAPAAPPPPAHDPLLVRIAKQLGMTDAQIAARTPDQLRDNVDVLNQLRLDAIDRDTAVDRGLANARHAQPAAPAVARPEPPPEPTFESELGADLEGFPDELKGVVKKLYEKTAVPLRVAEKKLAEYERREQHRAATTVHEAIADGYAAMGPEYVDLVGVGSDAEVTEDQRFIRTAIVSAVNAQPKVLVRPRDITAAIAAAGKKILGARTAKPAAAAEPLSIGGGTLDEGDDARPAQRAAHHIHEQVRNPNGTVGTRTKTQLDEEIERYNAQATTAPPSARTKPGGEAEDKPGPQKALRTAKKYLHSLNGSADE